MNRINTILNHLLENHNQYFWTLVTDSKYPAVMLGDIYAENVVFTLDDFNHRALITRVVSRTNDTYSHLSDLEYTPGIIELSHIADLVYTIREWLKQPQQVISEIKYDLMQNSKKYINDNFDF